MLKTSAKLDNRSFALLKNRQLTTYYFIPLRQKYVYLQSNEDCMKIFNTSLTRELDNYTIENEPISSIDLIERASMKFAEALKKEISNQQRVFIFAGPGNNGSDALSVARILSLDNYPVECFLFNPKDSLSADCETNKVKTSSIPTITFHEIKGSFSPPKIEKEDIIIDGLFGSGLNKPLAGGFASLVYFINKTGAKIYSIDIPSGLFGENNSQNTEATVIKAYKTFTFQFPKLAFLLPDSGIYVGKWEVLDIGIHPEAINQQETPYYYAEKQNISPLLHKRNSFAYKNTFGHALIIAGSKGKMGAAVLCAKACLRSGAGLVTSHLPECGETIMQTTFPEAMVVTDPENDFISKICDTTPYSAIGIGPGISTSEVTAIALKDLLFQCPKNLVLDADALNIISTHKEWLEFIPANSILTPHIGEFDRLAGVSTSSFERLEKAQNLASQLKSIIVLKGAYTAICSPDGDIHFNSSGNTGMATAGSGDALTGIITGLLAQNHSPLDAAKIGVYIHGLAGDIASKKHSQESLIASDIIDNMGAAFNCFS